MCKILKESSIQTLYSPTGEYEFQGNLTWINQDTEQKLEEFRRFVIRLRTKYNFDLNSIYNMDKTPVWFDMAGNITVNNKGDKTVHIRTTGNDKNHFTVGLTCLADEIKYPPICIFKGKQLPCGEVILKDFLFKFRMSENLSKEPAMMVYDSFRDHLEESVKTKFKQHNFQLAEWHEWMCKASAGLTTGNLKRVKISDVCSWIKRLWDAISDQIIFNSFKKCAISNLLDGSEDDMVYEKIDKLIEEYEKENLEELDDNDEIVDN
ncbi:hypothetical protein RhiirA5_437209 [Rhizophagus irregularis]|uniref:DDE-1 domain-containing protein n=1 Tax=Rhizophagus irregularis TaxID=588596 RepID=A0A2N0NKU1_9GLOM|nr:hypothetical protein RhiirA5_437209 [Rhizophagus irregularis]